MNALALVQEMKRSLTAAFGSRLRHVIVFGSEARGEAGPDSDIDVLVVLDGPLRLWSDLSIMVGATYDLRFLLGHPVHFLPVSTNDYEAGTWAVCRDAKREGLAA